MKSLLIFLILLSYGCSQVKPKNDDDDVSVYAAMNQAQSSYLLGCVEAMKPTTVNSVFPICRERAVKHRKEIEAIIRQVPLAPLAPSPQ